MATSALTIPGQVNRVDGSAPFSGGYQFGDVIRFIGSIKGAKQFADQQANLASAQQAADYENKLFLQNDSTKYQRAYKDLLAAGLNPRLLLSRGFDTNAGSPSVGYSASNSSSQSTSMSNSAIIVALIALAAKMIGA